MSGLDVVVEGQASRVTNNDLLTRLAAMWQDKLGWHYEVVDGAFREKGAEATDEAYVFALVPTKILAFGKGEPFSQTRYRF